MLARSLAKTLGLPLHVTAPGAWFCGPGNSGHLGDAAAAFRRCWADAVADAKTGGACLLLDEADGLMDRASGGDGGSNRVFWANLLSLINATMDDRPPGLCVIGATNAGSSAAPGSSIDAALRRRFGVGLTLGLPSARDLSEVVSFHLEGARSAAHASAGLGAWLVHRAPSEAAISLVNSDPVHRDVVDAHLRALYGEALTLVTRHRAAIERVADALLARRLLTGDDVRALAGDVAAGGAP